MMICPVCAGYGQNMSDDSDCNHCLGWGVMLSVDTTCSSCGGRVQAPMWCKRCGNTGKESKVTALTEAEHYDLPAKKLKETLTKLRVGYEHDDDNKALGLVTILLGRSAELDGHPIEKWLKSGHVIVEPSGIWVVKGKNGVRIHEFDVEYV